MSGQWEVVGKRKERGATNSKLPVPKNGNNKAENKKKAALLSGVKIEEVLPKSQVQNLYKNNKENKKPQPDKAKLQLDAKKQQKKPAEAPKPSKPKSIESALNSIDVSSINIVFETLRTRYPDGQIIWLRELAQYLNQSVPIEVQDPVFSTKPVGYPFSVIPSPLKNVIEKSLKEAGSNIASVFFGIALTTMATDMCKGSPCLGYKIYLQCIALNEPNLFAGGIGGNLLTLLSSYQNRPSIGLSILWAVGHAGVNNPNTGLKVFKEFMFPLLELKNYSRYIVKYLVELVGRLGEKSALSNEEFLLILDAVYSNKKNFPNDLKQQLINAVPKLQSQLFKSNNENHKANFAFFFKNLTAYNNKPYQDLIAKVLCQLFNLEASTLNHWTSCYKNNLVASGVLLNYLGENFGDVQKHRKAALREVLLDFEAINEKLFQQKKRKEDGLTEAVEAIKKINQKMAAKKKSGYSLTMLTIFLLFMTTTTIYLDISCTGSWKDSVLNRLITRVGLSPYIDQGITKANYGLTWVDARIEENIPGYRKTVCDFSDPYVRLLKNLGLVCYNIVVNIKDAIVEKVPVVVQSIESYAPGLLEQSQKSISSVWTSFHLCISNSVNYLKTEVFVGELSPENMQRVVLQAFNSTQQKATEYYHWLYEKVQTSIK